MPNRSDSLSSRNRVGKLVPVRIAGLLGSLGRLQDRRGLRGLRVLCSLWVLCGPQGAGLSPAAAAATPPAPSAAPADVAKAQAASAASLPAKYRDWLEEVAPLIGPKERAVFLVLQHDYQREEFIRRFWEVRDPFPQTARNELKDDWDAHVKLARERYGNVTEDRARMLLINGEPPRTYHSRCAELVPLEIWGYDRSALIRGSFHLVFYSPLGGTRGPYRLWHPSEGLLALTATGAQLREPGSFSTGTSRLLSQCSDGDEVAGYLASAVDWDQLEAEGHGIRRPGVEWLTTFTSYSTEVPPGAQPLPARLAISYPGCYGSRTVIQGVVDIPKGAVEPERLPIRPAPSAGGQEQAAAGTTGVFYDFLIDGEVLRNEELFEHFRYRFTMPESQAPGTDLPLVFQRHLRPGVYTLVLKVQDPAGKRCYREERELAVPAVERTEANATDAAPAALSGGAAAAAAGQPRPDAAPGAPGVRAGPDPVLAPLAEANGALRSAEQTIHILPMPPALLTGTTRVEAAVTGDRIARVRFLLDGKPLLAKTRPPYSVEVNLGSQPRTHLVKAVAESASGERLADDQLLINAGPHRFSVRLVDPQPGKTYLSSLRAQAEVEVPEGEKLDRVEFFLNDTRVATLFQPPFAQPILLPPSEKVGYVRAVAFLAGGTTAEDLVLINSPNPGERLDVEFVELFTTVTDHHGRFVDGLTRDDFKVFENGVPQTVGRFERVVDVPIYAAVMLDISGSMEEHLPQVVSGALRFFQKVIKPKDRAAVITFNGKTTLAVRFTSDPEVLAGGLAGLTADGNTVLYDSVIYTLYYFGGVRGKRAVILLTDGKDEGSHYSYTEALDYARRSGVSFYVVGIGHTAEEPDVRYKLVHLAEETGGRAFFIEHSSDLEGIYATVEAELRSQYLVAYQSTAPGNDGKFRSVEVKLSRPGLEAKTLRGYFP